MKAISANLKFFLSLAKAQNIISRRFDGKLNGLGQSELMILYHLSLAEDEKLRRVDLAEKIGLTASGVTRLLLPMEKIGLVKKEVNEQDARVSYVLLASGGKAKLEESLQRAQVFADDILPASKTKGLDKLSEILIGLGN